MAKKTNWMNNVSFCSLVVAIIALIVAFKSCSQSEKSNEITQAALDHAKKSFTVENRPYLVLQPIKDADKGFFIEFTFTKEGYELKVSFEVYNAGKTPAKAITIQGYTSRGFIEDDLVFSEKPLSPGTSRISLGPGEKKIIKLQVPLVYIPKSRHLSREESSGMTVAKNIDFRITLPVVYSSDMDEKAHFKTTVIYGFPNFREARLLGSD